MTQYADYNYYSNTYKGDMPIDDFERLVIRASYEVKKNISNKPIEGYEDEVQLATCSIADILLEIEKLENKKSSTISDKTLKSESVGDYSRTFDSSSVSDIDEGISNQNEKIKEELRKYLLDTGLLFRGV